MPSLLDANRCVANRLLLSAKDKNVADVLTCGRGLNFDVKLDFVKYFFGMSTLSLMPLIVFNFGYLPFWNRKDLVPYFDSMVQKWITELESHLDDDTVLLMPTFPVTAPYKSTILCLFPSVFYNAIFNITGLPSTQCPIGFDEQGLPYGIQIAGCKNNDALTIACAVELEKAFGGWKSPGTV
ncbi:Fatty-acid amide hydrolase 2-A like protein [Argiope bruennichi]|uniref:Fatty-acid amide hydrolase 2-A like protein n=1 Tax=Argiope bruennichi TaxID=94029 RepID=A0A8T0ETT6_ARGBR|nr:Fatty-acid amide hydrolase 2-A like protein [Argiope bruennichi]